MIYFVNEYNNLEEFLYDVRHEGDSISTEHLPAIEYGIKERTGAWVIIGGTTTIVMTHEGVMALNGGSGQLYAPVGEKFLIKDVFSNWQEGDS